MGYVFFWTFNTSMVSILGMVAVCFGGLKLLIGVIIYAGWLFALIFRPEYLKKKEAEEVNKPVEMKQKTWLDEHMPFVAEHWGTILEIVVLIAGVLIIVITKFS